MIEPPGTECGRLIACRPTDKESLTPSVVNPDAMSPHRASKPAVSPTSESAGARIFQRAAGLETGDTADLEVKLSAQIKNYFRTAMFFSSILAHACANCASLMAQSISITSISLRKLAFKLSNIARSAAGS